MKTTGGGRFLGLALAVGVIVALAVIFMSLRSPRSAFPGPGDRLPDLELTTLEGEPARLDQWARGMEEVLLITTTCDDCTGLLQTRLQVYRQRPDDFPARMERTLLLLIRTQGLARASFMQAFEGARNLGARVLIIEPDQALALGSDRVPTRFSLDEQGMITGVLGPQDLIGAPPPE